MILLTGMLLSSCSDWLDETLTSDVSASSYYTTPQGLEDAVKATYAEMKPFFGTEMGFTMTVFGTDMHTNGADGSHKAINFYDGGLSPTEGFIRDTWSGFYRGINQANAVINRSATIDMDPVLKEQRIAEVRFLRGLYYFILTQFYGDIHFSLDETEGVELTANKTSAEVIYSDAIIPDLEYAVSKLPDSQGDYGRATKPAAEFLLAKVYMTRFYKSFGVANDAVKAEELMTNVIDNYTFSLLPDFESLWELGNEENSEIIFSVQNSKQQVDEGTDGYGHRGHLYFLMEYDKMPGMTRDTDNGRPWKRFMPTDYLLGLYDNRANDSRYDKSYKHEWFSNSADNIPVWTQAEADAGYTTQANVDQPKFNVGDVAIFIPGPGEDVNWDQAKQAATPYMVITKDEYTQKLFPTLNKWIDPSRPNRQHTQGQRDFILMRLADAYLIRAEARFQQTDTQGAADDINVVRSRAAWLGDATALANMQILAADVTLDRILDERALELDGEGHRWFDLVRTNTLVDRVKLYNSDAAGNIQPYHVVRPIPQAQIDRTLGGYEQNCGYPGAGC